MYKKINKRFVLSLLWVAVLMTAAAGTAFGQERTIAGNVSDDRGEPVIGATVVVKGTSVGTVTAAEGTFRIQAKTGDVLVVSFLGYSTVEVSVGAASTYGVTLKSDDIFVEEVVVVGYGTSRVNDLTGSIASVSGKEIEGFKSASVIEALGGKVAGVQITSADGTPGAGFDIKIRGIGTLTGDASPLFIVDGFQVDNIDYLSNSDFESINFLKDASASAIYGARAANGVVLVTTKSGKEGKVTVSYNGSASYRSISSRLDVLSPYEYVKLQIEQKPDNAGTYFKSGTDDYGNLYRFQTIDDYIGVSGVDWQDETFRPTWSQDHNFSISGGNKETRYTLSYSNYGENGIFTNSSYGKNTAKLKLNQNLGKSAKLDLSVNYANMVKKGAGTSADNGRFNMLNQIIGARPTGGVKMTDEELLSAAIDPLELESEGASNLAQVNPIVQAQSVVNKRVTDQWIANAKFDINVFKNLKLSVAGNYNLQNFIQDIFYLESSREAFRAGGHTSGNKLMGKQLRWGNSNYLTYEIKKSKHNFDALLGQESTSVTTIGLRGDAEQFITDRFRTDNMSLGAVITDVSSYRTEKLLLSYFTRVNYQYDNRYLLTATLRMDGSSVFAPGNKWGWFPSFSAAWRISEEKFLKDRTAISNLKLKVGYGEVGNDRIDSYLSMNLYRDREYGIGQSSGVVWYAYNIANPYIKWEGSSTTNIGLDLGLFNNMLTVTVDAFVKNTKDLLLAKSMPYVSGVADRWENIGKIQNKGLEFSISSRNFAKKDFYWTTDFNISFIRNTLKALSSGEDYYYAWATFDSNYTNPDYIAYIGQSLGLMYGFEFDGVYQESDFYRNSSGALVLKPGVADISGRIQNAGEMGPGFVKYKDQDGDGVITDNDRTVIGNGTPKWYGGLTNSLGWKGIDFTFMFQFNYGNDIYNATRLWGNQTRLERTNKMAETADRWTAQNASNSIPKTYGYINGDIYSRFIEDGSFLRLKTVTLGYSLPKKVVNRLKMSKLRIYASGQNLFLLTNYTGFDPEVSMRASNPMMPGFDFGAYPKSKVFTFGLECQF